MTPAHFKYLFDQYYIPTLLFAAARIRSNLYSIVDPQDVAQQVFIRLWAKQPNLNEGAEKSYLFKSVEYLIIDIARHQHRQKHFKKEMLHFQTIPPEVPDLIEVSALERLYQSRTRLPEYCRKIFELCWAGCTTKEIAGILHISHQNVLNQKQKAIRILKKTLNH